MRSFYRIFDKNSCTIVRLLGVVAITMVLVGVFNIAVAGVPTIPLLIYRGGVVVFGLCLLFLASHLSQT